jgi:AcrR family transcriptional regulator
MQQSSRVAAEPGYDLTVCSNHTIKRRPVARSGSASRHSEKGVETRQALVTAAVEVLRTEGFAAATARAIATRAGCNPGLVFYHFGSVVNMLLAALDEVSAARRQRYEEVLAGVHDLEALAALAVQVFEEDLDTGDAALLVEMVAGASSTPGLGAEVQRRVAPWATFATTAIEAGLGPATLTGLVDPAVAAHALVALYFGLELMAHLDGDRAPALAVFDAVRRLAPLARLLAAPAPPTATTREVPS